MQKDVVRGMLEAKQMLRSLWGTSNVHIYGIAGTGFSALDSVLSLILPGDGAVAFPNGTFSGIDTQTIRRKVATAQELALNPLNPHAAGCTHSSPWLTSTRGPPRRLAMPKCQLTAEDSFALKALLNEPGQSDDLRAIVKEKLRSASLFLDHTIDRKVATLGSRVRFAVGETFHERVLSANPDYTIGLELALASVIGAVLIGLKEGQIAQFGSQTAK